MCNEIEMRNIEYYKEIRQKLHSHPDVSGKESYAHDLIVSELQALSPTRIFTHVGGYGVVAYWKKISCDAKQGLTIAFRADIDALPIGHCCGHDGHTAILLRFAEYVATHDLKNNVVLVFQPEEETGKGARKIIDEGVLKELGINAIYGLHNLPGYPKGTVVVENELCPFASASSGVVYRLVGRPTHASSPEKGINPGLAVAEIIERFHDLNLLDKNNWRFRMITLICCRIGEEAFGTSAGDAEVMFTMRTFFDKNLDLLFRDADAIVDEVAARYGLRVEKEVREPFSSTWSMPWLQKRMEEYLKPFFKIERIEHPFLWSEDFGEYLHGIRGVFFGLGSGEDQPELHHPDYNFPDDIIETGSKCFELIVENAE